MKKNAISVFMTIFLLFFGNTILLADNWIDYNPPIMDNRTVDPFRYSTQGEFFDLSGSEFRTIVHQQSALSKLVTQPDKKKIVIQCEFQGNKEFEYVHLLTPIKIETSGCRFGGRFKTSFDETGNVSVRFRDPSGEIHQQSFGKPNGEMQFVPVERMPHAWESWGGDNDKVLQFPCEIDSILLDRPRKDFAGKGTFEISDLVLYQSTEPQPMLKLQFASGNPQALVFEGQGTLRFRLTPVKPDFLKGDEKLYVKFDFRSAKNGNSFSNTNDSNLTGDAVRYCSALKSFIDPVNIKANGQTVDESILFKGLAVPAEGVVVEIPVTSTGAIRCVLFPETITFDNVSVNQPEKKRTGQPVFFSFGSITPNVPVDERFGTCTHYIWNWWSINSMPFIKRAGIGMLRDEVYWNIVEKNKGEYFFPAKAEEYINEAINLKIDPLIALNYSNPFYDNNGYPVSPEAQAGYAEYTKQFVKYYKNRIKYVEIWNEWYVGVGMSHLQSKEKQNTAENYVNLIKAASEAIRAENPEVYIIGGGGDHPDYHFQQIETEIKAGVMKYCDAYSLHPYRQPNKPDKGIVNEVLRVVDLMKQNGCREPKIWITEIGWPTPKQHPAPDTELFQASMLVRSAIPLLATGVVERYFWYNLKNKGLNRLDEEENFGLLRDDRLGLHAKPAYIAYAVMARHTAGRNIIADQQIGNEKENLFVFRLQKKNEPDILVLWTLEGTQSVKLTETATKACNLFGTPLKIPADNCWAISEEPLWISF
ncbi:MAG: glycoside hydrolase family 5 protein [Planctomycetaceae bacterium]|jgi:hypothetical protein|nr:glycoside hydrolase family 5 protein [Planctomycetaceae bacterium]